MIFHKVYVQHSNIEMSYLWVDIIEQAVNDTLAVEAVDMHCVVNVLMTDDEGISEYNQKYRDIDKATDVLSFPMQTFQQEGWSGICEPELDEDTGDIPLGDIVISIQSVERQAKEYNNQIEYELAYLIIHSTLHLLGYDHSNDINENAMHKKNKKIIQCMGFGVND